MRRAGAGGRRLRPRGVWLTSMAASIDEVRGSLDALSQAWTKRAGFPLNERVVDALYRADEALEPRVIDWDFFEHISISSHTLAALESVTCNANMLDDTLLQVVLRILAHLPAWMESPTLKYLRNTRILGAVLQLGTSEPRCFGAVALTLNSWLKYLQAPSAKAICQESIDMGTDIQRLVEEYISTPGLGNNPLERRRAQEVMKFGTQILKELSGAELVDATRLILGAIMRVTENEENFHVDTILECQKCLTCACFDLNWGEMEMEDLFLELGLVKHISCEQVILRDAILICALRNIFQTSERLQRAILQSPIFERIRSLRSSYNSETLQSANNVLDTILEICDEQNLELLVANRDIRMIVYRARNAKYKDGLKLVNALLYRAKSLSPKAKFPFLQLNLIRFVFGQQWHHVTEMWRHMEETTLSNYVEEFKSLPIPAVFEELAGMDASTFEDVVCALDFGDKHFDLAWVLFKFGVPFKRSTGKLTAMCFDDETTTVRFFDFYTIVWALGIASQPRLRALTQGRTWLTSDLWHSVWLALI